MQDPALSGTPQDLHVPAQAMPQQTPCAQMPEWQSLPAAHVAPIGFLPQLPETHVLPPMQSTSAAHAVLHWAPVPQV